MNQSGAVAAYCTKSAIRPQPNPKAKPHYGRLWTDSRGEKQTSILLHRFIQITDVLPRILTNNKVMWHKSHILYMSPTASSTGRISVVKADFRVWQLSLAGTCEDEGAACVNLSQRHPQDTKPPTDTRKCFICLNSYSESILEHKSNCNSYEQRRWQSEESRGQSSTCEHLITSWDLHWVHMGAWRREQLLLAAYDWVADGAGS